MSQADSTTQSAQDEIFIRAVNGQNYSAMQDALDGGSNVNVQNVRGITPLHAAVMARNMALVDWLAKRGANPSLKNLAGDSALHEAAKIEDVDFLDSLLGAKGADVNVANSLGSTPLMEAASAGRLQNVKALMKHKADPGLKSTQGASALLIAAGRQQHEMVSVLLAHGANPNDSNSYGVSALISAASAQSGSGGEEAAHEASAKTMKALIAAGADINLKAKSGNSPLAAAAQYQNRRGMMVLLNLGANPNVHTTAGVSGELTPLMAAAYKHDLELVALLIDRKADVNFTNNKGVNALSAAMANAPDSEKKQAAIEKIIESLLEAGALMGNEKSKMGLAHYAVLSNNASLLARAKSQQALDHKDQEGMTAVFYATIKRNEPLLRELGELGADFAAKDKKGSSALHVLATNPYPPQVVAAIGKMRQQKDEKRKADADMLEIQTRQSALDFTKRLVESGCPINGVDAKGNTPLHLALLAFASGKVERSYLDFMVDQGADLSTRNEQEESPFVQAVKIGNVPLVEAWAAKLIQAGRQAEVDSVIYDVSWTAPEHSAQVKALKEAFEALMKLGAKVGYQDEDGQFPLLIASATNQEDLASALIELGADVNQRNNEGEVAAFHSIKENRPNITRILFEKGCDPDSIRNDGESLMAIAYREHRSTAVQQIVEARQAWRESHPDEPSDVASHQAKKAAP